jgi:hypothetical protein
MSSRPSDWSALGLSGDPTPGDVDELNQVLAYLDQVSQATSTIETAIERVMGTASADNFSGLTAQAMQGQLSKDFKRFMSAASTAFSTAYTAVNTYATAMTTQQQIADTALSKAQSANLPTTDSQVQNWANEATQAGTDLTTASNTAANAVDSVSNGVQPISGWQLFLQALGWLALLLMIPAIIFGGPIALLAFAVNLVLFIGAAVEFAEGQIGVGQFLLSFLGILAPTTEGLDLAELLPALMKGIGNLAKDGAAVVKGGISDLLDAAHDFDFSSVFTVDTLITIGRFAYTAGIWVMHGIQDLPELLAGGALVTGKALGDFLKNVGEGIVSDLKTGAWLKLVLPVKGDEIASLGLGGAFRVGILERGLGVSADPLLNLKMVAVRGLNTGDGAVKLWSLSSESHFAADPFHAGIYTPTDLHLSTADLTLGLHGDVGTLHSPLVSVHSSVNMPSAVVTVPGHVVTPGGMQSLHNIGASLGTHIATPGGLHNVSSLGTVGSHVTTDATHGLGGVTASGSHALGGFTPVKLNLDMGGLNSFSHSAVGHAGSVLDIRAPIELHNVYHGSSIVAHFDDASIVIKDATFSPASAHIAASGMHGAEVSMPTLSADAGLNSVHGLGDAHSVGSMHSVDSSVSLGSMQEHMVNLKSMRVSGLDHVETGGVDATGARISSLPSFGAPAFKGDAFALLDHGAGKVDLGTGAAGLSTSFGKADVGLGKVDSGSSSHTAETHGLGSGSGSGSGSGDHADFGSNSVSSSGAGGHGGGYGGGGHAPDDAGVPGVLGDQTERVAVRWTAFKQAQHDYREALADHDKVYPKPDANGAESSKAVISAKGKEKATPDQVQAAVNLELAGSVLNDASAALHLLDEDPSRLAALEQSAINRSLAERPRLLGGSRNDLDQPLAHDPVTNRVIAAERQVGPNFRLNIAMPHQAPETGVLSRVGHDGGLVEVARGDLTEAAHGGFRLTDPANPGVFREFNADGTLHSLSITRPAVNDGRVLTFDHTQNTASGDITRGQHWNVDLRADGSIRLDHPNGAQHGSVEVDSLGNLRSQRLATRNLDDTRPGDTLEIDYRLNQAHVDANGVRTTFRYNADPGGHGFGLRPMDDADQAWRHFDGDGRLTAQSVRATTHDGTGDLGYIQLDFGRRQALIGHNTLDLDTNAADDGFRVTERGAPNNWRQFDTNHRLTNESHTLTGPLDHDLGHVEIDHGNGTATADSLGVAGTQYAYRGIGGGRFRLTAPGDNGRTWSEFGANGAVVRESRGITGPGNRALGHVAIDHGNGTATADGLGPAGTQYTYTAVGGGRFRLTAPGDNGRTWSEFGADGAVVSESRGITGVGDRALGHVEIDYRNNTATADGLGHAGMQYQYTAAGGGFRLTAPGRNGRTWSEFGANGALTREGHGITDQNGALVGHAEIDHGAQTTGTLHGGLGTPGTRYHYAPTNTGFRLTHPDAPGTWFGFDRGGRFTGRVLTTSVNDTQHLDRIEVDFGARNPARNAVLGPDAALEQVQGRFQELGNGAFGFTHDHGQLTFDGAGRLTSERVDVHDLNGNAVQIRVDYNHAGADDVHGNAVFSAHSNGQPLAHTAVARNADGHFTLTDTDPAAATRGNFTVYGRFDGATRGTGVPLRDHSGLHVYTDRLNPAHPMSLRNNRAGLGHFTVDRDPANNDIVLTDIRGAHRDDTRTFDPNGVPKAERITILDAKGRATAHAFEVDLEHNRWTRNVKADGSRVPGRGGPEPRAGGQHGQGPEHVYNGSGSVTRRNNGTLVLNGADKTPAYSREVLESGQTLELVRETTGTRSWHTWDGAGAVGRGSRHYSTEADGVTSWDLGKWGDTVREYRVTLDGGHVRAEKMPNGTIRWVRFTKDGDRALDGVRVTSWRGWKDIIGARDGVPEVVVQQKWNRFNLLGSASHYREQGIELRGAAYTPKPNAFKEISQQGKDAGGKDTLAGGSTLSWTRYAEQRPPDFLWKTPGGLDNWASKTVSYLIGGKYGAVDFGHDGFGFADSRYQVFKWTEQDGRGATAARGVRVTTPDGSYSDFTRGGGFVRGTIKLDSGNTVEIGRIVTGNDDVGKWKAFDAARGGDAQRPDSLEWREIDGNKQIVDGGAAHGYRYFGADGKTWTDTRVDPATNTEYVVRRIANDDGDVLHYQGALTDRPVFDPNTRAITRPGTAPSITRNTMGQIVGRDDRWGGIGGRPNPQPVHVGGSGDARVGRWRWNEDGGGNGLRISGRNDRWNGSWDDSYHDFERGPGNGPYQQVRDFRSLDKGKAVKAEKYTAADGTVTWHAEKYDAKGDAVPNTQAAREWKHGPGDYRSARPDGTGQVPWQDVRVVGGNRTVLREVVDGRVREYHVDANGIVDHQQWKEFDHGGVWRERTVSDPNRGLYLEKESFQKQWRMTNDRGVLVRYRSGAGRIWEVDAFGKWHLVGTEREAKGPLTAFRGYNRMLREPNRREFVVGDGAAGRLRGSGSLVSQKVLLDMAQDYTIDVVANIIITGATNDWQFNGDEWGTIFAGGAIKTAVKGAYGVMSETVLKGYRDGLRNMDGGKDFNRAPYNHDKHWDNEWAGNENPTRWRAGTFDFMVGTIGVGALGSFVSGAFDAAVFGVGKDDTKLTGGSALLAGVDSAGSTTLGNISYGVARTLGHQLSSGRLFHNAGVADITLQFGEKLLEKYLVNDVFAPAAHLKPQPPKSADDKSPDGKTASSTTTSQASANADLDPPAVVTA